MHRDLNLVADIGGTNTRVALARGAEVAPDSIRRYANAGHSDMAGVLRRYLDETGAGRIDGACVAMAGPVRDGVGQMTNLDWTVDRASLGAVTGAPRLAVLNDLQAQGHAVGHLDEDDLIRVAPQPLAPVHAAKLVVGIGTGFNAAPVYDTAGGRFVPPSECGHITLPQFGPQTSDLARALERSLGFAAVEDALSGRGIVAIHGFLHDGPPLTSARIIAALEAGDAEARATAQVFVQLLGAVVGDLALIHLPFGGIYLVGGMARAVTPHLGPLGFAGTLRSKGRFGPFLEQFGVSVVTDDFAALKGCALHLAHLPPG